MTRVPQIITVFRAGSGDGYTLHFGGPLYRRYNAALAAGRRIHGVYASTPEARDAIDLGDGTAVLLDGGPLKFVEAVEADEQARAAALAKLSPEERKLLGLADE